MKLSLLFAATVLVSAVAVPAQCLITTLTTQTIGPGCNVGSTGFCKVVGRPTTLNVTLDPGACSLSMQVDLFESCGVTVPLRAIAFGVQPAFLPLPQFGAGCALHEVPILFVPTTADPLVLTLPPGVPSLGFLAQALALSIAPVGGGGTDLLTFSDALAILLQ